MIIKSSLHKFRLLAMVFLFAINSLQGVAQVYRYTSPSSSIITNSDGNAINIPTDIPNNNTKHLVYLRSLKTVKNSSLFYFQELFQPVAGNFEDQTNSRINDHYFILLDSNEISSFKYSFYYGNSTSSYCFGQDFTSNFFYPGVIEYSIKNYAINCSKNEIPENTRATILTNELFCGIAPEKPKCLTIKGQYHKKVH